MIEHTRAIALRDELVDRYANCDAARLQDWNHFRVTLEALTTACEMVESVERQRDALLEAAVEVVRDKRKYAFGIRPETVSKLDAAIAAAKGER